MFMFSVLNLIITVILLSVLSVSVHKIRRLVNYAKQVWGAAAANHISKIYVKLVLCLICSVIITSISLINFIGMY